MLQLALNPGLTLTGFRTTRPRITFRLSFLFFLFIFVIRARPSPHPRLCVLSLARLAHQGVLADVVDADPKVRRDIQDRSGLQAGVLSVFLANKILWARLAP